MLTTPGPRARRVDLRVQLGTLRRGAGDPTVRFTSDGSLWWAARTPAGPGTLHLHPKAAQIQTRAWGAGAEWLLRQVPALLGADDDVSTFPAHLHPRVAAAHAAFPDFRVARSGLVFHHTLHAILEQKVTGQEAFAGYYRLIRRYGEVAPGPEPAGGPLLVPPAPEVVAQLASFNWLKLPVDPARSRAAVAAASRAAALERFASDSAGADRALRSLPGIGVWTSAEVRQRAHGDADAISFGDYHVAKDLGWWLTGAPVDDDALAELLEPFAGHRYRVQALSRLVGAHRPRHGPRLAPRTHLPGRVAPS